MRPGSVIVDLAVERGGNVEGAKPGEVADVDGVKIVGYSNPGRLAASRLEPLRPQPAMPSSTSWSTRRPRPSRSNCDDDIVKATVLTRDGAVVHPNFQPKSAA